MAAATTPTPPIPPPDNIRAQLRRDEDDRQWAYDDATGLTLPVGGTLHGNLTIGVGHNLSGEGLPQKIRDALLEYDLAIATTACDGNWPWAVALDDARRGVMLNLTFNMGSRKLATFTGFLGAAQAGNWEAASTNLLNSLAAKQEANRMARLAKQILTGIWQ